MSRVRGAAGRALALLGVVVVSAACATPVGISRVDTQAAHQQFADSAVANGQPSEPAQAMLRRFGMTERFAEAPAEALATLHHDLITVGGEDRMFALAELSFLHAARSGDRAHYLAAAVYAYALLFPGFEGVLAMDPSDPRVRLAYDLYNLGLAEGLRRPDGVEVELAPGVRALPFGWLRIDVDPTGFDWLGYRLERFVPTSTLAVRGLRNRYRHPGLGASLVAGLAPQSAAPGVVAARRIGVNARLPVTAVLRISDPRLSLISGNIDGKLEVYPTDRTTTVEIDGRERPLEYDPTAAMALWLQESPIWQQERAGFLGNSVILRQAGVRDRAQDGLYILEPYRPDRIPVVLVHGTASSPARWAELVNELRADPRIRERYQIWLFIYDNGNHIGYSAGRLRRALENAVGEADPSRRAESLRRMVVIGHSQGGLLTKLTAVDSGDRFWRNQMDVPFESLKLSEETRQLVQESVFFTPLPFVERVIFVATPHGGSHLAGWRVVHRLAARLVALPADVARRAAETATGDEEAKLLRLLQRPPTSLENMSPGNRFLRTLSTLPVAPGVVAHSIIAVKGDGPLESEGDGVVDYPAAHIGGVESELVVHSGHSVQGHPAVIEEIRRILLVHARGRAEAAR
jgi:pimeloyl-ACP methyl ester carboxylesterase